jgi:hypothetical protein
MKPTEAQGASSQRQATEEMFDWKRIARKILIDSMLALIIVELVRRGFQDFNTVQLLLLALSVVMVVVAVSMIYDAIAHYNG